MSNRIVNTARNATRIVNTSARAKTLDGATVGKALGAQASGYRLGKDTGPTTLYQMRGEVIRLLSSECGRPKRQCADNGDLLGNRASPSRI